MNSICEYKHGWANQSIYKPLWCLFWLLSKSDIKRFETIKSVQPCQTIEKGQWEIDQSLAWDQARIDKLFIKETKRSERHLHRHVENFQFWNWRRKQKRNKNNDNVIPFRRTYVRYYLADFKMIFLKVISIDCSKKGMLSLFMLDSY